MLIKIGTLINGTNNRFQPPGPEAAIAALFALGEDGLFYDPADTSSLFVARSGTTNPSHGDPVGLMLDKSRMGGLTAAAYISAQPELTTNGTFAGVSDGTALASLPHILSAHASYSMASEAIACTTTAPDQELVVRHEGLTVGSWYKFAFDYSGPGTPSVVVSGQPTSNGASFLWKAAGTSMDIAVRPNGNTPATASFDNFSFKEVPGKHGISPSDSARPQYLTDGTYHWIKTDRVDDTFVFEKTLITPGFIEASAVARESVDNYEFTFGHTTFAEPTPFSTFLHVDADLIYVRLDAGVRNTSGAYPVVGPQVLVSHRTATDVMIRLSGVEVLNVASAFSANYGFSRMFGQVSNYYGSPFYGAVILCREPTPAEIATIESFLAGRSGATI